jgi:hypothetical protein
MTKLIYAHLGPPSKPDTSSPAYLYARDQELRRRAEREARAASTKELLCVAHEAAQYCFEHVNPRADALYQRLTHAITAYEITHAPKTYAPDPLAPAGETAGPEGEPGRAEGSG